MNDRIGELLRFDPLDAAEKLTGGDYKTDESVMALGFAMHMDHAARKAAALKSTQDTYWGIPFDDALRVFESEGFGIVLDEPFVGKGYGDEPDRSERFVVMWNPLGVLLYVDSYGGDINGGGMNYAIRFDAKPEDVDWSIRSSSMWVNFDTDPVMVGHHDVREGFRYKFGRLRDAGTFVTPWPDTMMFSLVNYSVEDGRNAETARVLALLPTHIQAATGLSINLINQEGTK